MIKGKDVIGLKVMTVAEGKEIGTIKDIVYDSNSHEIKALVIDEGGMFSEARVILIPEIQSIGKDMVLIPDQSVVKKASEVEKSVSEITGKDQYLTNTKIVSEDGAELGKVTDVYFDPQSGKVHEFEVSQGFIGNLQSGKKRVRVEDIVTVGENATIVKGSVDEQFAEQGKQQGLTGALETAKTEAPNVMQNVKDTAHDLKQKADQQAQEIKSNPEVQKTMSDIKDKTEDAGEKIKQTADEVKDKIRDKAQEIRQNPNIEKVKEDFKEKREEVSEEVKEKADEVGDKVEDKTEDVQYSPAVQKAAENTEEIAQNIKNSSQQTPTDNDKPISVTSPSDSSVTIEETEDSTHIDIDIPIKKSEES